MNILAPGTVFVTSDDLYAMRKVWPGSGLPDGMCVSFSFDANGLVDVEWYTDEGVDAAEPEGVDGGCMVALAMDAQVFMNAQLARRDAREEVDDVDGVCLCGAPSRGGVCSVRGCVASMIESDGNGF